MESHSLPPLERGQKQGTGAATRDSYSMGNGRDKFIRDDIVALSCGDHMKRSLILLTNGACVALGAALVVAAFYLRFFSTVGKLYRGLDTSRPYCDGEDCEEFIVDIEYIIDIATISVIGTGALILLCSGMGYRAASQKDTCCLRTQSVLVVCFLLLQLAAGVGFVIMKDHILGLADEAWNIDIGVKAKIGKGRNERKVYVPPIRCAIQEALGCYGYSPMNYQGIGYMSRPDLMIANYKQAVLSSSAFDPGRDANYGYSNNPSLLFHEIYSNGAVPSCSGAIRPPSGGLTATSGDSTTGEIGMYANTETGEGGERMSQLPREVCCPTPAQRVIPRIQFDPMDRSLPQCSAIVPFYFFQYRLYVLCGIFGFFFLQILLIYNSQSLADSISQVHEYRRIGLSDPLVGSASSHHSSSRYT